MIICHTHRFIFLKPRKTAGTSVEIALSRYCGPEDIVTRVNDRDEQLRAAQGGLPGRDVPLPWSQLRPRHLHDMIKRRQRPPRLYNHVGAAAVRAFVGEDIWHSYLKISIERDPWDKAISLYWWARKGQEDFPSLSDYLRLAARDKPDRLTNWDVYAIDGQVVADRVLRFEHLADEVKALGAELGLTGLALPAVRAKSASREDRRAYADVLSEADAALVGEVCRREIEHFGFRFRRSSAA